jgi:CRISPR system Cascade subunit CasB
VSEINPFINYLCKLKDEDNRAALAHLRRGLGKPPGSEPQVYPYVVPWIQGKNQKESESYFIIASLFALHPEHIETGNMGMTFRQIWNESDQSDSIEKRFVQLLNSNREELPHRLRHAVSLAQSKGISINYNSLLLDVRWWDFNDSKRTQQYWAKEFWAAEKSNNKEK